MLPGEIAVHVFRVEEGLGNAVLLEFPDRSGAVVDWGTERIEPLELMSGLVSRLRVVVATHEHADHTMGIAQLLRYCNVRGIAIDRFVYPTSHIRERSCLTDARRAAAELGIPMSAIGVRVARQGTQPEELAWDDVRGWELLALAPPVEKAATAELVSVAKDRAAGNDTSAVVLFRFDRQSGNPDGVGQVLLPGDATAKLLQGAADVADENAITLANQLLVVPHHGGGGSVPQWVEHTVRGAAIVSGPTNSMKHPTPTTLLQIAKQTCETQPKRLYCTSYAAACRNRFATNAGSHAAHLVSEGACFGHISVRVPQAGHASLTRSSADGELRRQYGLCGHHATIIRGS